jgi:hypothetical protein
MITRSKRLVVYDVDCEIRNRRYIEFLSLYRAGVCAHQHTPRSVFAARPHTRREVGTRASAQHAAGLCGPSPLVCLNCYTYASLQWQSCIIYSMLIRVCEGVWADYATKLCRAPSRAHIAFFDGGVPYLGKRAEAWQPNEQKDGHAAAVRRGTTRGEGSESPQNVG